MTLCGNHRRGMRSQTCQTGSLALRVRFHQADRPLEFLDRVPVWLFWLFLWVISVRNALMKNMQFWLLYTGAQPVFGERSAGGADPMKLTFVPVFHA